MRLQYSKATKENLSLYRLRYEDIVTNHQETMDKFLGHCDMSTFNDWKILPISGVNEERLTQIDSNDKDLIRAEVEGVTESYGYQHPE